MKKLIILNLLLSTLLITGCSKPEYPQKTEGNIISIDNNYKDTVSYTPFSLEGSSLTPSPFSIFNDSLIYSNWNENNKIAFTKTPVTTTTLNPKDITNQLDYTTSTLISLNDNIYFGNSSNNNSLSVFNISTKELKQLNNNAVHMLSSLDNKLYYINLNDQKLYSYDMSTNKGGSISLDKVGKYIINNNFILFQNLSDNNKLYKIKLDGSNREAITPFSVDSFATYKNQLIVSNSSDNNYIYHINPMTLESKRLLLTTAYDIKSLNDRIFFLNNSEGNTLCELNLDLSKNTSSFKTIDNSFINEYFTSSIGLFIRKAATPNNINFIPLTK